NRQKRRERLLPRSSGKQLGQDECSLHYFPLHSDSLIRGSLATLQRQFRDNSLRFFHGNCLEQARSRKTLQKLQIDTSQALVKAAGDWLGRRVRVEFTAICLVRLPLVGLRVRLPLVGLRFVGRARFSIRVIERAAHAVLNFLYLLLVQL